MLDIRNLTQTFEEWKLDNVSFSVEKGKLCAIVGPSGSGKTTLLHLVAGLTQPENGTIILGGTDVTTTAPENRNLGVVFQDGALFPHLSVSENVAFGLKARGQQGAASKVKKALSLAGLAGFEKRDISTLSGGERQRVALARALAPEPGLLLLDEPFSNLDANLREQLKQTVRDIQRKQNITTLFVTHDLDEAFFLADSLVVLNNGRVEQTGTPLEIFRKPATAFVKRFTQDYVLVKATGKGARTLEGSLRVQADRPVKGKSAFFHIKRRNYRFEDELT